MTDNDEIQLQIFLATVAELQPLIEQTTEEMERERRLPRPLVDALVRAGLLQLGVTRALGGPEVSPEGMLRIGEAVSRIDGSVGWCVMVAAHISVGTVAFMGKEQSAEIYHGHPEACVAGVTAPTGRAYKVDGGYRVGGHWRFASGCTHSSWLGAGCMVYDGDSPRLGPNGKPEYRVMHLPASSCRILDTWHVLGLRGTGSHDFEIEDVFVPESMALSNLFQRPPEYPGTLYNFGSGIVPLTMAAVATGIALGVLDAFIDLSGKKVSSGTSRLLRDDPIVQSQVGHSEAMLAAGRALLYETTRETTSTLESGELLGDAQRTRHFLVGAHAAHLAAQAVDLLWNAAGTAGVFQSSPLECRLRDVRVVAQHPFLTATRYGDSGRLILGVT